MKWIVCMVFCCTCSPTFSQARWDGEAGDGLWISAINWEGDVIPAEGEVVLLDNSFIAQDYVVQLPGGVTQVSLSSLRISPEPGRHIRLTLPATNTSIPALTFTGPGDALILDAGAILLNTSGASSGTPIFINDQAWFRLNNGAKYIHRTERGHASLVARLSPAPGTEKGEFEFDVPGAASYTLSTSGRTYGTLILSSASAGVQKTYASSGTTSLTVRGDMILTGAVNFSYGANTRNIVVGGNLHVGIGATMNLANSGSSTIIWVAGNVANEGILTESGSSTGTAIGFNGAGQQLFIQQGQLSNQVGLVVNNAEGVKLQGRVDIAGNVSLGNGNLVTSGSGLLVLHSQATIAANASGFVEGALRRIGTGALQFPIGLGGIFAPLHLEPDINQTDTFEVEYIRSNPATTSGYGATVPASLDHLSLVEYWRVTGNAAAAAQKIGLGVSRWSFAGESASLRIAGSSETGWVDHGQSSFDAGAEDNGWITGMLWSLPGIAVSGVFTLASTAGSQINPLPAVITRFRWRDHEQRFIDWQVNDVTAGTRLVVERSMHGQPFVPVYQQLLTNGDNATGSFAESSPVPGSKYRLVLNLLNSFSVYSPVIVSRKTGGPDVFAAGGRIRLKVQSLSSARGQFQLYSAGGSLLDQWEAKLQPGMNILSRAHRHLPTGIYFLRTIIDVEAVTTPLFIQ